MGPNYKLQSSVLVASGFGLDTIKLVALKHAYTGLTPSSASVRATSTKGELSTSACTMFVFDRVAEQKLSCSCLSGSKRR